MISPDSPKIRPATICDDFIGKCTVAHRNKTRAQIQNTSKKNRNMIEISFNEFYSG